jgi:hypothetical protein
MSSLGQAISLNLLLEWRGLRGSGHKDFYTSTWYRRKHGWSKILARVYDLVDLVCDGPTMSIAYTATNGDWS